MKPPKAIGRLEIATADLEDAKRLYQRNFGLKPHPGSAGDFASLTIGEVEIRLISGQSAASILASAGEGMATLHLETDDLDETIAALRRAGYPAGPIVQETGRRVAAIDPSLVSQTRLYLFDRKGSS